MIAGAALATVAASSVRHSAAQSLTGSLTGDLWLG